MIETTRLSISNMFIASLNLQSETKARILSHKDITDSMWEISKDVPGDLRNITSINLARSLMTKSLCIAFKICSKISRHTRYGQVIHYSFYYTTFLHWYLFGIVSGIPKKPTQNHTGDPHLVWGISTGPQCPTGFPLCTEWTWVQKWKDTRFPNPNS